MSYILFWSFFIWGIIDRENPAGVIMLFLSALFRIAAEIHRLSNSNQSRSDGCDS